MTQFIYMFRDTDYNMLISITPGPLSMSKQERRLRQIAITRKYEIVKSELFKKRARTSVGYKK